MRLIILILLWSLSTAVYATGTSYATIKLTPIATHPHGEVLFKIYRNINGRGAGTLHAIRYGWLVVSSQGVWSERVALVGNDSPDMSAKILAYEKGEINLVTPDIVLKELMEKYGFTADTPLINERHKVLALKPTQSCYLGRCVDRVLLQKTIENYYSDSIETTVTSHFTYKGVVLVHNSFEGDMGMKKGGRFDIKNFMIYPDKDIGYFSMKVDGIVLLDNESIEKPLINFKGDLGYLNYSGCLKKEDEKNVRRFLIELAKVNKHKIKSFKKYFASYLIDKEGNFDQEVLFGFLKDYIGRKYDQPQALSIGTFNASFSKEYHGCYKYTYTYTSPPGEGEYFTWISISRDPSDGMIKIMAIGLAG